MRELSTLITCSLCNQSFVSHVQWTAATNFPKTATCAIDFGPGGTKHCPSWLASRKWTSWECFWLLSLSFKAHHTYITTSDIPLLHVPWLYKHPHQITALSPINNIHKTNNHSSYLPSPLAHMNCPIWSWPFGSPVFFGALPIHVISHCTLILVNYLFPYLLALDERWIIVRFTYSWFLT